MEEQAYIWIVTLRELGYGIRRILYASDQEITAYGYALGEAYDSKLEYKWDPIQGEWCAGYLWCMKVGKIPLNQPIKQPSEESKLNFNW